MNVWRATTSAVLLALGPLAIARADEPPSAPTPAPPAPDAKALEERLHAVEQELRELRARANAPASPAPSAPQAAPPAGTQPLTTFAEGTTRAGTKATLTIGGYVETFYQWNFNEPSNGITNFRGFDNRHNSFTIDNAVLDAQGALGPVSAHVALQVGHTPETYYLAEPVSRGTSAAGSTGPAVWKFLQVASVGLTAPLGHGLLVEGGIFLSPVGPEGMAVKDQWNWSRSDLFFGLPFYHTGIRATYPVTQRWSASLMVCNGWNSVVDNNPEKSIMAQGTYNVPDHVTVNLLYMTGVERPDGAPEGRAWRHLFDAYVAFYPRPWLSLLAQADGGFEPNTSGTSAWAAGAVYARFRIVRWLYAAARGDYFWEHVPDGATPIFWHGASWVSSGTATLDVRPRDNVSVRLEYRHDQAQKDLYFRDVVSTDMTGAFIPNATSQDTLTLGATAWF